MKYMIMMFGDQASMMETRSPEWISRDDRVHEQGQRGSRARPASSWRRRGSPTRARRRSSARGRHPGRDRRPVRRVEGVARRLLDPRRRERGAGARVHAKHIVAFTEGPIEVRQVMDGPPDELPVEVTADRRHRGPAARARAAGPRRARAPARAVRRLRGRGAGGAARGRAAVAGGRAYRTTRGRGS